MAKVRVKFRELARVPPMIVSLYHYSFRRLLTLGSLEIRLLSIAFSSKGLVCCVFKGPSFGWMEHKVFGYMYTRSYLHMRGRSELTIKSFKEIRSIAQGRRTENLLEEFKTLIRSFQGSPT